MTASLHENLAFLVKPASADCNLFCDYCFYRKTAADYPETSTHRMTIDTFETLVRKAQIPKRRAVSYLWQGGEPMLMGLDFFRTALDIQDRHRQPGQQVTNTIQTNAVAIDDEWAAFFSDSHMLVGVSVDGPRDLHNIHRFTRTGDSVFDRVETACETLDKHGVEFNILAVVNADTVNHADEIYGYFRERGFYYLQFIDCMEAAEGSLAPFSVNPDTYGEFLCRLFDLWLADGYPDVSIRLFDNYLQYRTGLIPECCLYRDGCGEYLVVEYNGDLFPCDFFVAKDWKLGNILNCDIDTAINSSLRSQFAALRSIPHDDCEDCPWLGFCRRGCIRSRWLPEGDYSSLNYLCGAYRRFFEYAEDTYRFLAWDIMRRHRGEPVPNPGRNDLCPCGSGKKYKRCCSTYHDLMIK